jgi:hypothetical protein
MENETKVNPVMFAEGRNYLITCDGCFTAPDGELYRMAFGPVKIVDAEAVLGIRSNARSTNWYAVVGYENQSVTIAGCQIHYAVRTDEIAEGLDQPRDRAENMKDWDRPRVWTPVDTAKKVKPIDLGEFKFSVDTSAIDHLTKSMERAIRLQNMKHFFGSGSRLIRRFIG